MIYDSESLPGQFWLTASMSISELVAAIGVVRAAGEDDDNLRQIQIALLQSGNGHSVDMDALLQALGPADARESIPAGHPIAAQLYLAQAICLRAMLQVQQTYECEPDTRVEDCLRLLTRVEAYLVTLARKVNAREGVQEDWI